MSCSYKLLALTVLILYASIRNTNQEKAKCDFDNDTKIYICNNIQKQFPNRTYGNYELECKNCDIQVLEKNLFNSPNELFAIILNSNNIKNISSRCFQNLPNLKYISIKKNHIRNLTRNAFTPLKNLLSLQLDHNKLSVLTPKFLEDVRVEVLMLENNALEEIPPNVFEGILEIYTIDLSHNRLSTLDQDSFNYLNSLEYLYMDNNLICNLPLGVFKSFKVLRELHLANNKIRKFYTGIFSGMRNLRVLNLSGNNLIELSPSIIAPLIELVSLDVSHNGLKYIDATGLAQCTGSNARNFDKLQIYLHQNLWSCPVLNNIISILNSNMIDAMVHEDYNVTNINGIACIDKELMPLEYQIYYDRGYNSFYEIIEEFTKELYNSVKYC